MKQERIELSQRERERLKVLHEVEQRLDGSRWLRFCGHYLTLVARSSALRPSATPSGLRPTGVAENQKPKPKYIPPPDHPWRRTFLLGKKADISTLR